jgi:cobalt-zinc-cadmium efflux system protein
MSDIHQHTLHLTADRENEDARRLVISILLNLSITLAEIIGGLVSGSLSLLSDALHNFSDTASLGISLIAYRWSQRAPDRHNTFGYRRAQIIGALINLLTLIIVAFYLIKEAIQRYFQPHPIQGQVMLIVAVIGLVANLATAAFLYRQANYNLNFRSAFVHILSDALSSIGVITGSILIIRYRLYLIDALLTLIIAIYILIHTYTLLKQTINILMQGVPEGLDIDQIIATIKSLRHVQDVHHVHIWQLDEAQANFEAHIVIDQNDSVKIPAIKESIKKHLAADFNITHSTLEFEFKENEGCAPASCCEAKTYVKS